MTVLHSMQWPGKIFYKILGVFDTSYFTELWPNDCIQG